MPREIIWVRVNSSKQVMAACSHALTLHSCVTLMHAHARTATLISICPDIWKKRKFTSRILDFTFDESRCISQWADFIDLYLCTIVGRRKYDGTTFKVPKSSVHKCCSCSLLSFLYLFGIMFITATFSKRGAKLRAMLLVAWLWSRKWFKLDSNKEHGHSKHSKNTRISWE